MLPALRQVWSALTTSAPYRTLALKAKTARAHVTQLRTEGRGFRTCWWSLSRLHLERWWTGGSTHDSILHARDAAGMQLHLELPGHSGQSTEDAAATWVAPSQSHLLPAAGYCNCMLDKDTSFSAGVGEDALSAEKLHTHSQKFCPHMVLVRFAVT